MGELTRGILWINGFDTGLVRQVDLKAVVRVMLREAETSEKIDLLKAEAIAGNF